MRLVERGRSAVAATRRGFDQAQRRYGWLAHLVRAVSRYRDRSGGQHAAAVAYYGFFAVFALGLVGFAVLGYVVGGDQRTLAAVQNYLSRNLPTLDVSALMDPAVQRAAGIIGLFGLLLAGLGWVEALRSAMRDLWGLHRSPGNYVVRKAIDLVVLAGLGLLLLLSLGIAIVVGTALRWLVSAADVDTSVVAWLLRLAGAGLGMAVNTVLAAALLVALPRLSMRWRRVLGPAVLVALGLEVIKGIGKLYIEHIAANPAYHLVAGAVGLLVFLYLFHQLLLFAVALTATSRTGDPTDLACRNRPVPPPD